jgi:hypothetical protein
VSRLNAVSCKVLDKEIISAQTDQEKNEVAVGCE